MDMFDEIDKVAKDFPRLKKVAKNVTSNKVNNYQIFSYVIMGIFIGIGFLFGNLFPSCGNYSSLYYDQCSMTEFNFSLTIGIWFLGLMVTVFFYGMGEIISLLRGMNQKLEKK